MCVLTCFDVACGRHISYLANWRSSASLFSAYNASFLNSFLVVEGEKNTNIPNLSHTNTENCCLCSTLKQTGVPWGRLREVRSLELGERELISHLILFTHANTQISYLSSHNHMSYRCRVITVMSLNHDDVAKNIYIEVHSHHLILWKALTSFTNYICLLLSQTHQWKQGVFKEKQLKLWCVHHTKLSYGFRRLGI